MIDRLLKSIRTPERPLQVATLYGELHTNEHAATDAVAFQLGKTIERYGCSITINSLAWQRCYRMY